MRFSCPSTDQPHTLVARIKAIQQLPQIKILKPGQVSRQQIKVFPTILNPTDRVVFFLDELTTDVAPWKADRTAVAELLKMAAARSPVP